MKDLLYPFLVIIFVFVLDQATKVLVLATFEQGDVINVIPDFFNLTLVMNPGAAFGLFSNLPTFYRRLVLGVVTFIAIVLVIMLLKNEAKDDRYARFGLFLILGGALGNLIDRFLYDAVVDFLDFFVGNYHWPAFNIADSAITIGVTLLFIRFMFFQKKSEAEVKEDKTDIPAEA